MSYLPQGQLRPFLERLPKTETHLHIEGALPWQLIHALDPETFQAPPQSWQKDYKFRDFAHFETELLDMACAWYTSPERYFEAAGIIFRTLKKKQNVHYLETSFASGVIEYFELDGKAVAEAIQSAAPPGMTVKVFMGIHHDGYNDRSAAFIEDCLSWDALAGVDLHGTETTPMESWTADFWKRARDAGKFTKAHAGEFAGPEFIDRVIDELGVIRIQHGVRAVEDAAIMRKLADLGAVLDVCPISNVKLDVVDKMFNHPIRELVDAGICCTINTDDPISFGNTLMEEYTALHEDLGFSIAELGNLAKNGFLNALEGKDAFQQQIQSIDSLVEEYSQGEA